ncbi:hypothetical protein SDC9_69812 [bioreactor metagenome]|uniref:Uncharacterized protein n=1 Tax=bioreactor metagenome TaxID=1076179 RepID=A0A644Y5W2_9ZZZZ
MFRLSADQRFRRERNDGAYVRRAHSDADDFRVFMPRFEQAVGNVRRKPVSARNEVEVRLLRRQLVHGGKQAVAVVPGIFVAMQRSMNQRAAELKGRKHSAILKKAVDGRADGFLCVRAARERVDENCRFHGFTSTLNAFPSASVSNASEAFSSSNRCVISRRKCAGFCRIIS